MRSRVLILAFFLVGCSALPDALVSWGTNTAEVAKVGKSVAGPSPAGWLFEIVIGLGGATAAIGAAFGGKKIRDHMSKSKKPGNGVDEGH